MKEISEMWSTLNRSFVEFVSENMLGKKMNRLVGNIFTRKMGQFEDIIVKITIKMVKKL